MEASSTKSGIFNSGVGAYFRLDVRPLRIRVIAYPTRAPSISSTTTFADGHSLRILPRIPSNAYLGAVQQQLPVRRLIKTDDERPPPLEGRRSQVSRRPQKNAGQGVLVRFPGFHVNVNHAFAFGDIDFLRLMCQTQGVPALEGGFPRVHLRGAFNPILRKKLLRFRTARSTRPVISPIQACHVALLFYSPPARFEMEPIVPASTQNLMRGVEEVLWF